MTVYLFLCSSVCANMIYLLASLKSKMGFFLKKKEKRITFVKLWRAIDLPLQEPVFCTYKSDLIYHPRQKNYYCCQHVFILIWPCIINFTQQTPFIVFKCKCGIEPCVSWVETVNNAKYLLLLPAQSVSL